MYKYSFKCSLVALALTSMLGGIPPAYGDNASVEDALRSRPDLSEFYQALVNTGVNHELQEGASYTVFAPTNEAFAQIGPEQYPCFYRPECRAQVAAIVRDHIIPGDVYVDDAAHQRGGVYSISNRFIAVGEPSRGNFAIAGNNVFYQTQFGSVILYKIDGVIADRQDLAALSIPVTVMARAMPPVLPDNATVTTTRQAINDPACGPGGCPDKVVTTVTHTVNAPAVDYNAIAPAR